MHRICTTLAANGFEVTLVGRKKHASAVLDKEVYHCVRLRAWFETGFLFYACYNVRLFFWLLFTRTDVICAIDLDTILPCYFVSVLRGKQKVYDAHEYFTGLKEVVSRPFVHRCWSAIEKFCLPRFPHGYTVSESIASAFYDRYGIRYAVIRNVPVLTETTPAARTGKIILYQGAVNEARGLEELVQAMEQVDAPLYIYGDGNIYERLAGLIKMKGMGHKIHLNGMIPPADLRAVTTAAYIGVNLVEPVGLNQLYSLANKFFDYIHAGVPQLTMNFPEYRKINDQFEVAVLADSVEPKEIAARLVLLLHDEDLYRRLQDNCVKARQVFNWQNEEIKLLEFYNRLTGTERDPG